MPEKFCGLLFLVHFQNADFLSVCTFGGLGYFTGKVSIVTKGDQTSTTVLLFCAWLSDCFAFPDEL